MSSGPIDENLDPRVIDEEKKNGPVEELAELPVDKCDKSKTLKIGKNLSDELREKLETFLKDNLDVRSIKSSCLNLIRFEDGLCR